ncbi:MAG TPA: S16 family serine protease, partial [Thermoanaerobaculia bacterium]|nr:S16 family serine protease [Thermoanaerobaculia bacterium]
AGGEALDHAYLGDLARLAGDDEVAVGEYLAALAEEPSEPALIGWLLEQGTRVAAAAVASYFGVPDRAARARAVLEAALRERPRAAAGWRRLAAFHELFGEEREAAHCRARANALAEAAGRQGRAVGRVLSAAVYRFAGEGKGLIHEVWADRRSTSPGAGGRLEEILGNLTPEMTVAVRNIFVSVREYARAKLPEQTSSLLDYNYGYKVTKEDEPSGGLSAGLPTALAFLSVFLDRPVPQDLAASGALVADAHDVLVVRPVGEVELKVRGAYNRDLRALLLPAANRRDLEDSRYVPREVCAELVRFVSNLDQAATCVFGESLWLD